MPGRTLESGVQELQEEALLRGRQGIHLNDATKVMF